MSISKDPDSLNNDPQKLDQKLTEDSWENFTEDPAIPVPSDGIRSRIEQEIGPMPMPSPASAPVRAPVRKIRRYAWTAIAASVVLLAGIFLLTAKKEKPATAIAATRPPAPQPPASKLISNHATATIDIVLPDGSKVALAGKSSLKYYTPFINGKRDFYLTGAATFNVTKNEKMPFVVHAKDITTTVLGTIFSVSDKLERYTRVRLFSGKVVVKKETPGSSGNIYLSPGDILTIDKTSFVTDIKHPVTMPVRINAGPVQPARDETLTFDNWPLEQIFRQLQQTCGITIQYDGAILKNITFTGKFNNKKETVNALLQTICDLNELTLTKTDETHYAIHVN